MNQFVISKFRLDQSTRRVGATVLVFPLLWLLSLSPALAHHPTGGEIPDSFVTGLLSGLGHPVIGLDHLAFVIAAGLLAAALGQGLSIPIVFVVASLGGTGLHLLAVNLPVPESVIAASVLVFGSLLAMQYQPKLLIILALAAIAGLFHGYAYGEAIIGAEMTATVAYLIGFATIQMAIAAAAYAIARRFSPTDETEPLPLRFAGFTLAGIGGAFLSGTWLG
ncbi:MAG: HupE/UreJ family protein [Leptolyngbyaceae cyanobacterium]